MNFAKSLRTAPIIAGYWDRVANHMTEAMQYLASLEEMEDVQRPELRERMDAIQREVGAHRARYQALLPKGSG